MAHCEVGIIHESGSNQARRQQGNRFEAFSGGYHPYPDWKPKTRTFDNLGQGLDYPQRKLHETFLTVVT